MKSKILLLLMMICLLTGCAANNASENQKTETTNISTKETESTKAEVYLVEFEANTVDGEKFSSEEFANTRLTMINVWATYCNPCLSEMPDLGEIAASYDEADFRIIGVISDVAEGGNESDLKTAKELIEQTKADYPHLVLNESLYMNLVGGVSSVPTTFFVNREGELLGYLVGAQSKENWEAVINELLEKCE